MVESRTILFGLCILAAGTLPALTASSGAMPTIDAQKGCERSAKNVGDIIGPGIITVETCMKQEQAAREEIIKNLAQYPSPDRQRCMDTKVYMPSYVEWLTCLEMFDQVRKLRGEYKAQSSQSRSP